MHEPRRIQVDWPPTNAFPCPVGARTREFRSAPFRRPPYRLLSRRCLDLEALRARKERMNRLPGCDRPTVRAEAGVFCCLALVAVALISMALRDAMQFVSEQDAIVAVLEKGIPVRTQYAGGFRTNIASTNVPAQPRASGGNVPARATISAPRE
jgi:hypothetical protein